MEKTLFDYNELADCGPEYAVFADCTLKQNIGVYKTGDKFDQIVIKWVSGDMELWSVTTKLATFKLGLVVL